MIIPQGLEDILVSTPDTLGGTARFKGTRVPVQALLDTLQRGYGIDYFLEGWPDVSQAQAAAFMAWQENQTRALFGIAEAA